MVRLDNSNGATTVLTDSGDRSVEEEAPERRAGGFSPADIARRRFTWAAAIATAISFIPFAWVLWGLYEAPDPLRRAIYQSNFYDLQARAMFHGHLWLANGAIGIEAFTHDGHQYTYFGLFPSIIRMPILLVTSSLDSRLTGPSMLLAWLLTALFSSLLLWRVRVLIRGPVAMGLAEATSFGLLVATFMVGTIWVFLANTPYVFSEDLAWSICLTVGAVFALLGMLERPSRKRFALCAVLLLCSNLDRVTTAWALVAATVLIAGWFWLGKGGKDNRHWWLPMLLCGLIPLFIGCAVNYAKFGIPFGVPVAHQVWTSVNAYRRRFLAANHNSEVGTTFIVSNIVAYLRPWGLRFTDVFPFITLPAKPAASFGGVLFDRRYRTASMPASMPLLFLLTCWGAITSFRPKPVGKVALTRFLLIATAGAGAALMLWGYIAPRYLADFVPVLVLGASVGIVDIWRRLDGAKRSYRISAVGAVGILAAFSIAANIGMSITPNEEWNTDQVIHYVETQKAISDVTGNPIESNVHQGNALPPYGKGDQIYIVGNCDGLYISNGEDYSTVPSDQFQRTTWMTAELGHAYDHTFDITLARSNSGAQVPLITAGNNTIYVSAIPTNDGWEMWFTMDGPHGTLGGPLTRGIHSGVPQQVQVITDPNKHMLQVYVKGTLDLSGVLYDASPISVSPSPTSGPITVRNVTATTAGPSLCRSLLAGKS